MSRTAATPYAALVLLAGALASPTPVLAQQGRLREAYRARFLGKPAPPFTLKDLKGRTVRLADYRGKVVLLNFWFSTCGPCRMETPDLIDLYGNYKGRGLMVLGINMDEILTPEFHGQQLAEFLQEYNVTYPILVADGKVFKDYGSPPVQPVSYLVDKEGKIVQLFWGAYPGSSYDQMIRPHLAAPAAAQAPATRPGPAPGSKPATPPASGTSHPRR
ncbi:MAG TPA: TlpA disulfide reductase family protein [Candidatus Polarisedimenticolia bacterium]|nr:TlpA disulfide reductase family protein [Candidatus Polarisedimenticolia bacterium]